MCSDDQIKLFPADRLGASQCMAEREEGAPRPLSRKLTDPCRTLVGVESYKALQGPTCRSQAAEPLSLAPIV